MNITQWWQQYGYIVIDAALYIGLALALMWISWLIYDTRQARREKKEAALWRQQHEKE